MFGQVLVKQIVPYLLKSSSSYFNDDLWTLNILLQQIIRVLSPCKIHGLARKSLLHKDTLTNDIEFQDHEQFHWPSKGEEQCDSPFMPRNLAPLRFHIAWPKCLMYPNKLRNIGPFRSIEKQYRKQASAVQSNCADRTISHNFNRVRFAGMVKQNLSLFWLR